MTDWRSIPFDLAPPQFFPCKSKLPPLPPNSPDFIDATFFSCHSSNFSISRAWSKLTKCRVSGPLCDQKSGLTIVDERHFNSLRLGERDLTRALAQTFQAENSNCCRKRNSHLPSSGFPCLLRTPTGSKQGNCRSSKEPFGKCEPQTEPAGNKRLPVASLELPALPQIRVNRRWRTGLPDPGKWIFFLTILIPRAFNGSVAPIRTVLENRCI